MTVTIWDTNTDAIATRREITGWTTPEGDASPEPIYSDPVPLERLTAAIWTRPTVERNHAGRPGELRREQLQRG
jgi:hypothetical protein